MKLLFYMDAIPHSIADLKNLLNTSHKSDVTIGSRYVEGGNFLVGWTIQKIYFLYFNLTCRKLLRIEISDFTSGFRVYDAKSVF